MPGTKALCLLTILAVLSLSQDIDFSRPTIRSVPIPFSGVFATSWFGGFCQTSKCDDVAISNWDGKSFTIHGLWPNGRSENIYNRFDVANIKSNFTLYNNLMNYWPPRSSQLAKGCKDISSKDCDPHWLWGHEYNKHGFDYTNILQYYQPDTYLRPNITAQTLQQATFQAALTFYHMQNLENLNLGQKSGDIEITKASLAKIINLNESNFILKCKGKILSQIQICFQIQKNLTFSHYDCSKIKLRETSPKFYPIVDKCGRNNTNVTMIGYQAKRRHNQVTLTNHSQRDLTL